MLVMCPNCHETIQAGAMGIDYNTGRTHHVDATQKINGMKIIVKHKIGLEYVEYKNKCMYQGSFLF
ncbi:hypothetical protein QFZ77_000005 [Paenibacillus sp. V4I3]|nr:hypothetical protein [Paenibacillus sp. V4I3]